MTGASPVFKNLRFDSFAVVANIDPQAQGIIPNFNSHMTGSRVAEGVPQRLRRDPIHFVPNDGMEILYGSLHNYFEFRSVRARNFGGKFLSDGLNGHGQIVGRGGGCAQILHCTATLGNRLTGLLDCVVEPFPGVLGPGRK